MRHDADRETKRLREPRDRPADAPPAEQHETPPGEAVQPRLCLELPGVSLLHVLVVRLEMAREREQQRHRVLGDLRRAVVHDVRHRDAELFRRREVHRTVACRVERDDAEPPRSSEHFARQRQKSRHERVGLGERALELLRRGVWHDAHDGIGMHALDLRFLPRIAFIHRLRIITKQHVHRPSLHSCVRGCPASPGRRRPFPPSCRS